MPNSTGSSCPSRLLDDFRKAFPDCPTDAVRAFRAPGRVNLIGEHTDYNEGMVLPGAITFDVVVACSPNRSGELAVHSLQEKESFSFSLEESHIEPQHNWTDYIRGVQIELIRRGFKIPGAQLLIDGHVPIGAGLSSSAALEVAAALALLHTCGGSLSHAELAKLCQRAENEFVGARCGIMDQFSSLNGRTAHAILLDCRSLEFSYVPLPNEIAVIICNTMVRHSVATGAYNQRRAECESCVRYFQSKRKGISALRDVTPEDLERYGSELPVLLRRRAKHVITENVRVLETANALQKANLQAVGQLMRASHASLRDDYEVSCPELDLMVELAFKIPGTYGSRMTGGGFGGCTVSLVDPNAVERFKTEVATGYKSATKIHPDIVVTRLSDGAGPV